MSTTYNIKNNAYVDHVEPLGIPTVDPQLWTTYRQALRDVPTQQGFPRDINWPPEPTT